MKKSADDEIRKEEKGRFVSKVFVISSVLIFFAGISIYAVIRDKYYDHNEFEQIDLSSGSLISSDLSDIGKSQTSISDVPVYIVGAVEVPGIYMTELPVYLYQLVEMAGGLTGKADSQMINLAFLVTENMMIIIPEKECAGDTSAGGYTTLSDASSVIPFIDNEKDGSFPVNINNADISQLCLLPGIGNATAEDIIEYRKANGPFESIEDIMKVPGIKQSRFEKIRNKIKV